MVIGDSDIRNIITTLQCAGSEIMSIYNGLDVKVELKSDRTPLTVADTRSHEIIESEFRKHFPQIPFLSEESSITAYEERRSWEYFWLIDPLDGTKEFIQHNGEFTINVALIHNDSPIFGAVYLPTSGVVYIGNKDKGAHKKSFDGSIEPLNTKKPSTERITVVKTRSHPDPKEEKILKELGDIEIVHAGSSLKFCYVADSKADLYLRGGPTMEWDTAAGQCVAECAGATMCNLEGKPFTYNKPVLKNPGFICAANKEIFTRIVSHT